MSSIRSTRWCFTLNNYSPEEVALLQEHVLLETSKVKFLTWGEEVGEEGTPHLQGCVFLDTTQSLVYVKRVLSPRAHWEKMAGRPQAAIDYCHKDAHNVWSWGTPPKGAGTRTDIAMMHEDLQANVPLQEISNRHFGLFLRYSRGVERWTSLNSSGLDRPAPQILWIYGESGTGKSLAAKEVVATVGPEQVYALSATPTGAWWDGYTGQKYVLMDDFRGNWMPHFQALRTLDGGQLQVAFKGGMVWLKATRFIVTSNKPPQDTYAEDPSGALMRRIVDFAWVFQIVNGERVCESSPKVHADEEWDFIAP